MTDEQLLAMWKEFGDIPITEEEDIDEPFYGWPIGTNRFKIWEWFDQSHSKGVAYLIYPNEQE